MVVLDLSGWQTASLVVLLVAFFIFIFVRVFRMTAGMVATASQFFTAMKSGNLPEARSYLTDQVTSPEAAPAEALMMEYLSKTPFSKWKKSRWIQRQVSGDEGFLQGSIKLEDGSRVPLRITFSKINGCWKIRSFRKPPSRFKVDFEIGLGDGN